MTALGHLVFILAFVGIARSALIVPFWRHLPEVSIQQEILKAGREDEKKKTSKQKLFTWNIY